MQNPLSSFMFATPIYLTNLVYPNSCGTLFLSKHMEETNLEKLRMSPLNLDVKFMDECPCVAMWTRTLYSVVSGLDQEVLRAVEDDMPQKILCF